MERGIPECCLERNARIEGHSGMLALHYFNSPNRRLAHLVFKRCLPYS